MKEYRGCYATLQKREFTMGADYAYAIIACNRETSLIAEREIDMDEKCLTPRRNEYGKQMRKEYESGQLSESRHNMQQLEPREDGLTNTLTSVQKDNLLLCGDGEVQSAAIRGREETRVREVGNLYKGEGQAYDSPQRGRVYAEEGLSPTLNGIGHGGVEPKILEAEEMKGREKAFREVQEKSKNKRGGATTTIIEDDGTIRVSINTQKARGASAAEEEVQHENNPAQALTTAHKPQVYRASTKYRIRKLTERECFRLMDVDEKDIDTIQAAGISKTRQYKLAGNSIVVACLFHLFRKMFVETENENEQLTLW